MCIRDSLYSDEACKLFAESGAIQPVLGIADDLDGDNKMFYSIYDNGAKAAMGNFAAFSAIPGVEAVSYTHLDVYKRQLQTTGMKVS